MLNQKYITRIGLLCLPLLLIQLTGCTVIGLGIGHSIDTRETPLPEATPKNIEDIPEGATIIAQLENGEEIKGTFLYYSQIDSSLVIQKPGKLYSLDASSVNSLEEGDSEWLERESKWIEGEQMQIKIQELTLLTVQGTGHSGRVVGTLIGAAIDTALLVAISMSMNFNMNISSSGGSWF